MVFSLYSSLFWQLRDKRNLNKIHFWPESLELGAMSEYWYIERGQTQSHVCARPFFLYFFNSSPCSYHGLFYAGADPGEVKWVNFHPLFSEPPPFFFFLSLKYLNNIWFLWHYYKNSPPISKSWIHPCVNIFASQISFTVWIWVVIMLWFYVY